MDKISAKKLIFVSANRVWLEGLIHQHSLFCKCKDIKDHINKWLTQGDLEPEPETGAGDSPPGDEGIEELIHAFEEDNEG
nr:ORF2 [Anelloviridae sp.]